LLAGGQLAGGTVVAMISGSGFRETFLTAERSPSSSRQTEIEGLPDLLAQMQENF